MTYFESLVLQNSLDGGIFAARRQLGLEDNTKRAIPDYLALGVLHVFGFARQSILHSLANNLCWHQSVSLMDPCTQTSNRLPPMRRLLKTPGLFWDMFVLFSSRRIHLEQLCCTTEIGSKNGDGV